MDEALKVLLKKIHSKVELRPSPKDSNFNYVHQKDVIGLVKQAYLEGHKTNQKIYCMVNNCHAEAMHCYCDTHHDEIREMWLEKGESIWI